MAKLSRSAANSLFDRSAAFLYYTIYERDPNAPCAMCVYRALKQLRWHTVDDAHIPAPCTQFRWIYWSKSIEYISSVLLNDETTETQTRTDPHSLHQRYKVLQVEKIPGTRVAVLAPVPCTVKHDYDGTNRKYIVYIDSISNSHLL